MPQSVCIEQIEGYIRNRADRSSFNVVDDGTAIDLRVPMNRLVTKEGCNISAICVTVSCDPCSVVLTMPDVCHPVAFAAVNVFPKRVGHRSSALRAFPYAMAAEYDRAARRLDLKMIVPAVGPSVTQGEFYEAVSAFIHIADRWAARIQRPPQRQGDDEANGPLEGPINGPLDGPMRHPGEGEAGEE